MKEILANCDYTRKRYALLYIRYYNKQTQHMPLECKQQTLTAVSSVVSQRGEDHVIGRRDAFRRESRSTATTRQHHPVYCDMALCILRHVWIRW